MVRPATETLSLVASQPTVRLNVAPKAQPQEGGLTAVDRQLQMRYAEAPGLLPLGAANLLQRRITRLAADHLPLWHRLQRRWLTNVTPPWAFAGEMPLVHGRSHVQRATAFAADEFLSDPTALPSALPVTARAPVVTPVHPGAKAAVARQPWPPPTLPADSPDQAQVTNQTNWGKALLQRHLTGVAIHNAPLLSRLATTTPGTHHFLANAHTPAATPAHSTALGSPLVALRRSALATADEAMPVLVPQPPVTETVVSAAQPVTDLVEQTPPLVTQNASAVQATQPVTDLVEQAPPLVTRNVAEVASEQSATPKAQRAMTAPPQPPSHTVLPAILPADSRLVHTTATGASPRGSVQRLSALPATRSSELGTASQTSAALPVLDTVSSAPVPPVAVVQRAQAWGTAGGEVHTHTTAASPSFPLASSPSRTGDSTTMMGAPIVQRRRAERVRSGVAQPPQPSASQPVQTADAVVVQEPAPLATAGQRPPTASPVVQTAPIPPLPIAPPISSLDPTHRAESVSGAQAPQATMPVVQRTAALRQPAIIQRGAQRSNLGQRRQVGATQWAAPASAAATAPIAARRFDAPQASISVSGTAAGNDTRAGAETQDATPMLPAVATRPLAYGAPAYGDTTAVALSPHELARSVTADSSRLPGVANMNATPALMQRNRGAPPSAASAHPLTSQPVQAERTEQRERPPMPMRTDVERKQTSAPAAAVHSEAEQGGHLLLQRHVAGASSAWPVSGSEQSLARQALSAHAPVPAAVAQRPAATAYPLQPHRLADPGRAPSAAAVASTHTVAPPGQPLAEPLVFEEGLPTPVEPPPMTFVQPLTSRPAPHLPAAVQAVSAGQGTAAPVLPVSNRVTPAAAQRAVQSIAAGQRLDAQRLPLPPTWLAKAQTISAAPAPHDLPLRTLGTTLLQRYVGGTSTPWGQLVAASPLTTNADVGTAEPLPWLAPAALPQRALAAPSTPATICDNRPAPASQTESQPAILHRLATTIARATDEPTASVNAPSPLSTMTTPIAPATGPPPSALAPIDVERLADRVYAIIEQRLVMERESMGL